MLSHSRALDRPEDGQEGRRRTEAEGGGGQPGRKAAPVREPLQRIADTDAVDDARTAAAEDLGGVEHGEGRRLRDDNPGQAGQHAAGDHQPAWAEALGEVSFERDQPGLRWREKNRKGIQDTDAAPTVFLLERVDEQRPGVLEAGHGHHGRNAGGKLHPAIVQGRRGLRLIMLALLPTHAGPPCLWERHCLRPDFKAQRTRVKSRRCRSTASGRNVR